MGKSSTVFVGMDVHKESIELATADEAGRATRPIKGLWLAARPLWIEGLDGTTPTES